MADAEVTKRVGLAGETILDFKLPRGLKGDKGDKGDDGANVLPTDTAVANAITTNGTATKAALNAAIGYSADQTGTDDRANLQAQINASASNGKPVILTRNAVYLVSGPLTLPSGTVVEGNGATIKAKAGNNTYVLTNADRTTGNDRIILRDLKVDGNAAEQTAQFNTIELMRVTHSKFENLDVTGAKRNATFPNGTNGDGLCLIYSHYNEIVGGYFHHNTYDGIKLRSSNHNRIVSPLCEENGRSGIQLAFYSPTGPPYNVGEGVEAEGSNHNTILTPTVLHSTGTPHAYAPTTSGVYIHTGFRNTIVGIQARGVRSGIGVFAGAWDNEFNGGFIAINHVDRAAIHLEGGPAGLFRNSFKGITGRALSGANGKHVLVSAGVAGSGLNRFENCYFSKGAGTGDWTVDVGAGATDTWFSGCSRDGSLNDAGANTVWHGPNLTSGKYRMETPLNFAPIAATPTTPATNNTNVFVNANGQLCIQDSAGRVTIIGYGSLTLPGGDIPPAADATRRGQLRFVPGVGDAYDRLHLCRKREAGVYEWVQIA